MRRGFGLRLDEALPAVAGHRHIEALRVSVGSKKPWRHQHCGQSSFRTTWKPIEEMVSSFKGFLGGPRAAETLLARINVDPLLIKSS